MTVPGGPGRLPPAGAGSPRRHRHRPGPPPDRVLNRHGGGRLIDVRLHEPVTLDELIQDLRASRQFVVRDHRTGEDCTYQVLAEVIAWALGAWVPTAAAHSPLNPATLLGDPPRRGATPTGGR
ncbi:polyhydroxyalkanoate synthesis regulator DNA-binding domain-containing protein [Streptomyces sp. MST-110588]|uniref:polyhydroxyalkanoate synthesis regulator DNA-binding domain-containing protein n=1 Tax=Streptomyces sp. MST-110588 TaxID=2833628 RepID=UPI001F5DB0EB|nr:polyhydroxyalkanoate synthesis regulator DNA-binding domain-containing protein [Streptomyces sp. MST-110588]UNO41955.1 hypothetical protein KGS77_23455 [Streptomyces sp. MST-110588]